MNSFNLTTHLSSAAPMIAKVNDNNNKVSSAVSQAHVFRLSPLTLLIVCSKIIYIFVHHILDLEAFFVDQTSNQTFNIIIQCNICEMEIFVGTPLITSFPLLQSLSANYSFTSAVRTHDILAYGQLNNYT